MNVSKMADLKPFLLLVAVVLPCAAVDGAAQAGPALTAQDQSESEADRGNLANRFDSPFAEITDEDIDSLFSE